MPPKTQKQKEEEAARLAEEQRLKEEEEEKLRKELEKYLIIKLSKTNLPMPITKYYIETVYPHEEPYKTTIEYISKLAEINNCKSRLRDIDIQITADQVLNDLVFANSLHMNLEEVQVLINILFLVFTNNNSKFSETLRYSNTLNKKDQLGDQEMFNHLIKIHAEQGYFKATHIKLIMEYFKNYINHIDLINLTFKIDQRPLELHLDLQIDLPLMPPSLDDALIYRQQEQKVEDEQAVEDVKVEDQQPPSEPTDEELLDSVIMDAIQKKLDSAKQELEEKLEARKVDMEQKLMSLTTKKK